MSAKAAMERRALEIDNETTSQTTRVTKDGKTLHYHLEVLQQPERARACGAGQKSSADRRPVDPPPIVKLRIFDGSAPETDVTFTMNANYFLFATLEQARPIAHPHGRAPDSKQQQQLTVLAGTPVAGMVYLERPKPAGYFIFPDLSVRHEGKYRLSFSLYEELKDGIDENGIDQASRASTPGDAHVTHRLEVKSVPFDVFSAKKFPGLTESTSLSRCVAEQGCRVRIRRDVRQRRRDTKSFGGKEWDDYEDATADARARTSAEPDPSARPPYADIAGRPRSSSNASLPSLPNALSRRASQEMHQSYNQPCGIGPHTPQQVYNPAPAYGPSPSQQYQASYVAHQSMQPPPPQYGPPQTYPVPPPMPVSSPSLPSFGQGYTQAPTAYSQPSQAAAFDSRYRSSIDSVAPPSYEARRSSSQYSIPPPPPPPYRTQSVASYQAPSTMQQPYSHGHHMSYGSQDGLNGRAPPQPVQPPARASGATTPLSARPSFEKQQLLPPLNMPPFDLTSKLEPSDPSESYSAVSVASESRKRSAPSTYQRGSLQHGARPNNLYYGDGADADADESSSSFSIAPGGRKMEYQRANGDKVTRHLL